MFQQGLYELLIGTTALTSLLGKTTDGTPCVFPILAPGEIQPPYVIYQRVSGAPVFSYQGTNRLHDARFRFSCYGQSYPSAAAIAEQLKLLFASYTGTLTDGTVVEQVMQELEADDTESTMRGTIYGVHLDFAFWYQDNA